MSDEWKLLTDEIPTTLDSLEKILLKNRGIKSKVKFYSSDYKYIHSPLLLFNIENSCEKLKKYIDDKSKIYIHGDYDADGIIATSILFDYLYRKLGADVLPIIPDRVKEGYSLSKSTLDKILESGAKLVISVDCGVRDKDLIDEYCKKGLDFIITDHHEFAEDTKGKPIIPTDTLVHPGHPKGKYPNKYLSGAAVAWKFIWAYDLLINKSKDISEDIKDYIDLAGISLVTDIMPLIGENRIIVKEALRKIPETNNLGLKELVKVSGLEKISSDAIGYTIGPRINSAGRIGNPLDAVKLFTTKNSKLASEIANDLNSLNTKRRDITIESNSIVDETIINNSKIIIIKTDNVHEGMIGLIAGRYSQKYKKPTIVFTKGENETLKGSARSIKQINITEILANFSDLFIKYGGHSQAAGITLLESNFSEFEIQINKYFEEEIDITYVNELEIDSTIESNIINLDLIKLIKKFEPYGEANPKPTLLLNNSKVIDYSAVGKDKSHVKISLLNNGNYLNTIGFNLYDKYKTLSGDNVDIVFYPSLNTWNGNSEIQLELIDIN